VVGRLFRLAPQLVVEKRLDDVVSRRVTALGPATGPSLQGTQADR
jgi:hypothetical protein